MTFGVCAGCGAVAWELLEDLSDYCMGCNSAAYRHDDDDDDECAYCDCGADECCMERSGTTTPEASPASEVQP